ncbi:uncharacterized protein [Mytilus edulis]|uniref:CSRNP n=1 Tax=Mytilus edulis TaxID=6550 RepID=A0A8S3UKU5_MYTED|nr:CSRNP [Mytilus edulis]
MLKRKIEEIGDLSSDIDDNSSSSVITNSSSDVPTSIVMLKKKRQKKSVKFKGVTVYYFPRMQGFTCVPSEGGSTLGMLHKHSHIESFSIPDHAKEQKRLHTLMIEEMKKQEKKSAKYLGSDEEDEDEEDMEDDSDFENDDYYVLTPITTRQRRILLRQSGVKKIESGEKDGCRDIRNSRELCGCDCQVFCDPETCACSQEGIQCQVDRLSFPCGCSKDGCGNLQGRIEFNPIRVRTHFIHTLMRLQLDKKEEVDLSPVTKIQKGQELEQEKIESDVDSAHCSDDEQKTIDLTEFNSNELGSCRDCQNSDVCNVMMQEVQYASQQQRTALIYQSQQYRESQSNVLPRVYLYNESDELYNTDSMSSLYNYKEDESSYSESSSTENSPPYENVDYPEKSYQTLTPFTTEQTNQNFSSHSNNISPQSSFISNSQPEKKYTSLNSADQFYKVTDQMTAGVVPNNWMSSYSGPQNRVVSTCYTTMTNTTSDKIAEACPAILSHINHHDNGYTDGITVEKYQDPFSVNCGDVKTYIDLDKSSSSQSETGNHCVTNQQGQSEAQTWNNSSEVGQNFGEIIKESLVETVHVSA